VRSYDGPISHISEAFASQRYLWAFCLTCGASRRFHPRDLLRVCPSDAKLAAIAKRFSCKRCNRRTAILVPAVEQFPGRA